jgi:hypothetical protein
MFSRLAAVSQGGPASHQGIPDDAALAARLVNVREFLHHQRLHSVRVLGAV